MLIEVKVYTSDKRYQAKNSRGIPVLTFAFSASLSSLAFWLFISCAISESLYLKSFSSFSRAAFVSVSWDSRALICSMASSSVIFG